MTTEVETTVVEPQVTALAPVSGGLAVEQQREAGLNALARMSDAEFSERKRSLLVGLARFDEMMREVLTSGSTPDCDLMTVPGIEKPVFTLSAAEKVCFIARLAPSFVIERTAGIPPEAPAIHYIVRCRLHLGNTDGPVVAEGVGSASSHERKYRWRFAEKHCPECGVVGALILSKWEAKGGPFKGQKPWVCLRKKGGCGAEFAPEDESVLKQKLGMVENADPHDLDNTLLKMAKKRAFVDGTKTATAASGRVTVDMEEGTPGTDEAEKLRTEVLARAKAAGFGSRGELYAAVRAVLGKPVKNMDEFGKLTAVELAKVLDRMPAPKDAAPPKDDATEPLHDVDDEAPEEEEWQGGPGVEP